jgi:excisionase family DNA binding protein
MPNVVLLSTAEAAERAEVHVRTIHRWVETGRLEPFHKLPGETGSYLFLAASVDAAVNTKAAS